MIKAVIIDDEINSRELIYQMLSDYCDGVHILGTANDIKPGIILINEKKPDVVFLDVKLPNGTGFDILNATKFKKFRTVFVTGYQNYAIKAIKYAAFDFILKPINLDELIQSINKIKATPYANNNFKFLKENINKSPEKTTQIILSDNKNHNIIQIKDIIYIESERNYVTFHLTHQIKFVVTNSLHYYEELLPSNCFFRVHRSYIINCKKIIHLDSGRGGLIHLSEDICLPIAVRRKPALLRFLDHL